MNRLLALSLVAGVLLMSRDAAAQVEGRFRSGILTWTPTLTLRDAGTDSNVYDEATNPKRDTSAVFTPQIDGTFGFAMTDLRFAGAADFVYFQRYTNERSVNVRGDARLELRGSRLRPFAAVGIVDGRERVNSEIDVRARHADRRVAAGAGIALSSRTTFEIGGSFNRAEYRQGETFRGTDLAHRLNRDTTAATARVRYDVTPLTRLVLEGSASRDRFLLSPGYDADNLAGSVGVEFEPDAIIKGRAKIGYHRIAPVGDLAFGFDGVTAAVELGYVLLARTRVDVRVARDTTYSFEAQPYFLQTIYGGEILHNVAGPVDVIGRASWETMEYPGIASRNLPADTLDVTRYGGGLAIRAGARSRVTINYEQTEREGLSPERHYDRRRVYSTVTYGF